MAKGKKSTENAKAEVSDTLAQELAASINKEYSKSHGQVAYTGDVDNPADIVDWVSTGCDVLDLAISNRKNGGMPVGRIVEITGMQASGKSLLAAHLIAETQKKGGLGIYFDTEIATSRAFFSAIGVDMDKMLYLPMNRLEEIFKAIEDFVSKVRDRNAKGSERTVTIVVDSIMGATTKTEDEDTYEKGGWATDKAIILSKAMRKITHMVGKERILLVFTNQLRQKLGVSFGDPYTTSGGFGIPFHSSVRIRLKSKGQIKIAGGPDPVIGIATECKIHKNRLGPPLKKVDIDIYFDSGLDNYGSWLKMMKNYDLVTQAGAWYTYDFDGKPIKFQSKEFLTKLKTVEGLKDYMYNHICDAYIKGYKPNKDFGIDDITISKPEESEQLDI